MATTVQPPYSVTTSYQNCTSSHIFNRSVVTDPVLGDLSHSGNLLQLFCVNRDLMIILTKFVGKEGGNR